MTSGSLAAVMASSPSPRAAMAHPPTHGVEMAPRYSRVVVDGLPFWQLPTGRMIPVISGGAGDDDQTGDDSSTGDDQTPPAAEGDTDTDPAAELVATRAALKKANAEAAKYRKLAHDSKAAHDAVALEKLPETERALAEAAQRAQAEADQRWRDRVLTAEVRAAAAGKIVDPDLALKLLDTEGLWSGDELDGEALAKALDELVTARPYLASTRKGAPPAQIGTGRTLDPDEMSDEEFRRWRAEQRGR